MNAEGENVFLRINNLVDLIATNDKDALNKLRNNYPEYKAVLTSGNIQLGPDSKKIAFIIDTAIGAMTVAQQNTNDGFSKMKKKISSASKIRFAGQAIASITSGGLLTSVLSKSSPYLILIGAIICFVANLCALFVQYQEKALIGGEGSLLTEYNKMVNFRIKAFSLEKDLIVLKEIAESLNEIKDKVAEANEVAANLMSIDYLLI